MEGKQSKYIRRDWLNLRLGRKIFTCKFCNRDFQSSQALGGHQNAHKREKTMLQHCTAAAMAASLGVEQHSHVYNPGGAAAAAPRLSHPGGAAWQPYALNQLPNFVWPGSSRQVELPNPDVLDLDLKL